MKLNLSLLVLFILPLFAVAQSPWTPGHKKQYHQVSFSILYNYEKLLNQGEDVQLERFVSDYTLQYYGEIGLGDKFSITLIAPFKILKAGDIAVPSNITPTTTSGRLNAFGDIQIAGKYQIIKNDKFILAANLLFGLPSARIQENTGLRAGYKAFQVSPGLSIGMGKKRFYTYGFFSYNYYNNGFPSGIHTGVEFGWKFNKGFILALSYDANIAFGEGTKTPTSENLATGLYLPGFEYSAPQLKIMKEFFDAKLGVFASTGGLGLGAGNWIPQRPSVTFGVYSKI